MIKARLAIALVVLVLLCLSENRVDTEATTKPAQWETVGGLLFERLGSGTYSRIF